MRYFLYLQKIVFVLAESIIFFQPICAFELHDEKKNLSIISSTFNTNNLLPELLVFFINKSSQISSKKTSKVEHISGIVDIVEARSAIDDMIININRIPKKVIEQLKILLFLENIKNKLEYENKNFANGNAVEKIDALINAAASYNMAIDYVKSLSKSYKSMFYKDLMNDKSLIPMESFKIRAMCNQIISNEYFGKMIVSLKSVLSKNNLKSIDDINFYKLINTSMQQIIRHKDLYFISEKTFDKKMHLINAVILYNKTLIAVTNNGKKNAVHQKYQMISINSSGTYLNKIFQKIEIINAAAESKI